MKVIIAFTFCCDNLWKSKFITQEKPGKLWEFFSPALWPLCLSCKCSKEKLWGRYVGQFTTMGWVFEPQPMLSGQWLKRSTSDLTCDLIFSTSTIGLLREMVFLPPFTLMPVVHCHLQALISLVIHGL